MLAECSSLTSLKDWRDHVGHPSVYQFSAFARRHDAYISVRPCTPSEPVCVDERSNDGVPFFFFYQTVFKRIGMCLPFSGFERELITEINVTPAQLHPNSWAFVKAFGILCGYFGQPFSVDIFLHFFEVKKQGKSLWVSFSGIARRVLLSLFQQSYKGWRGKLFRVSCTEHDHTALDGLPLHWVKEVKLTKPKTLDELPSTDREVCQILASVGVLDTAELIAREYDSEALTKYISMGTTPHLSSLISASASFHSCLHMNCLFASCSNLACAYLLLCLLPWCRFKNGQEQKAEACQSLDSQGQSCVQGSWGLHTPSL